MSIEKFACESCYLLFRAQASFWLGYKAICPRCSAECEILTDEPVSSAFGGMDVDAPLFEIVETTEADIEGERDIIHDEIAEALADADAEADVNTAEISGETDGESDADGEGGAGSA